MSIISTSYTSQWSLTALQAVQTSATCLPHRLSDGARWGDALPEAKVVRHELAGVPRVEVAGLSKERGLRNCSGTRLPRSGPIWRKCHRNNFRSGMRLVE